MVKDDATYAVITSGNYELVLRRHREFQTVYISEVIATFKSENPSHYRLHTSLIVSSYLDTLDRANQLEKLSHLDPTLPWISTYAQDYAYDTCKYPLYILPYGANLVADPEKKNKVVSGSTTQQLTGTNVCRVE